MPELTRTASLPARLLGDLRTDHAGETGAVMIYRGVLATARDAGARAFAQEHLATEAAHLVAIDQLLAPRHRSRLLPLWRAAGWLTAHRPPCSACALGRSTQVCAGRKICRRI